MHLRHSLALLEDFALLICESARQEKAILHVTAKSLIEDLHSYTKRHHGAASAVAEHLDALQTQFKHLAGLAGDDSKSFAHLSRVRGILGELRIALGCAEPSG